jgi:hypothetical protein
LLEEDEEEEDKEV